MREVTTMEKKNASIRKCTSHRDRHARVSSSSSFNSSADGVEC